MSVRKMTHFDIYFLNQKAIGLYFVCEKGMTKWEKSYLIIFLVRL